MKALKQTSIAISVALCALCATAAAKEVNLASTPNEITAQQGLISRPAPRSRSVGPQVEPLDLWYFEGAPSQGANFKQAWQTVGMSAPIVVAVVDTGILKHKDMAPYLTGYDFVSDARMAMDGDGRDPNPVDVSRRCIHKDLRQYDRGWHGLEMASIVSSFGKDRIAGATGNLVLPVRAMTPCGASVEDVSDAMLWSAGLYDKSDVPANKHPARIIAASFGSELDKCPASMQKTIDRLTQAGVVVVAAAGNEATNKLNMPANCAGVVSVAAYTKEGELADYSNFSTALTVAAPSGGQNKLSKEPSLPGIWVKSNFGEKDPEGDSHLQEVLGTSPATALVASAVALGLQAHPQATHPEILSALRLSASPFTPGTYCAQPTKPCGQAGRLNAGQFVRLMRELAKAELKVASPAGVGTKPIW